MIGAVVATVDFDNISKFAAKIKIGENGYAYIIDKTGLVLYHPKNDKILKENFSNNPNPEFKALIEKMKSGQSGFGYYNYDGVYKYSRFIQTDKWILVVTANYDEYMSPAKKIKEITVLIAAISLLIALSLAYLISDRNIVKPIKNLEDLMTKAGNGDLSVRSKINTGDEIQILGDYFNHMMENQSGIITYIRRGSHELTNASEELSASIEEMSASTRTGIS